MDLEQLKQMLASGAITSDQYETTVKVLGLAQQAIVEGATAVGEKAVNVGNDVNAPIITGNRNDFSITYQSVDTIFQQLVDPNAPKEQVLRRIYLIRILDLCNKLTLGGVDSKPVNNKHSQLRLASVYTALLTSRPSQAGHHAMEGFDFSDMLSAGKGALFDRVSGRPISALEHLNEDKYLVLLGDPGSGKSTFVNFVSFCLAGQLLQNKDVNLGLLTQPLPEERDRANEENRKPERQPWVHGSLMPVRIVLRDLAARGLPKPGEEATSTHLWSFISREFDRWLLAEYVPYLQDELREVGGLILFDGLDEVPDADSRRLQILQLIQATRSAFPLCRILITSRTYAYQKTEWQLDDINVALIAPFSAGQIRHFVTNWYNHVADVRQEDRGDYQGRAVLLQQNIDNNPRLYELAERPILLTLMASLHEQRGGSLPENREALYADAVDLLLDTREEQRVIRDASGNYQLAQPSLMSWLKLETEKADVRYLLSCLAFKSRVNQANLMGTANISEESLVMGLFRLSKKSQNQTDPALLIEYLSQRAGILINKGNGVYTFPHRTFQEYLAACYLKDDDENFPNNVADLVRKDPHRWREVALLAGARANQIPAAFWSFIEELCPYEDIENHDSIENAWGAHIAAQAIIETAKLDRLGKTAKIKVDRVKRWLAYLLRIPHLPYNERMLMGQHLAILGDPRPEVTDVASMEFCWIPHGEFVMGSNLEKLPNEVSEWRPKHTFNLEYDYWLARFPVSNEQYQEFIDAGGYSVAAYWPEAKQHGYWENGRIRSYTYSQYKGEGEWQTRNHQADYGMPFNLPNHPAVGISWYEALAFTRWLTVLGRQKGWLTDNWEVRLPNEPEWEKASKGGVLIPLDHTDHQILSIENFVSFESSNVVLVENPDLERLYPWDSSPEITPEHGNYLSDSKHSSVLGMYVKGISPYGCEEMGGNVAEWTRSLHGFYDDIDEKYKTIYTHPYNPTDGREETTKDERYGRTMKMGLWGAGPSWVTCAARIRGYPDDGFDLDGFRVCIGPSISSFP